MLNTCWQVLYILAASSWPAFNHVQAYGQIGRLFLSLIAGDWGDVGIRQRLSVCVCPSYLTLNTHTAYISYHCFITIYRDTSHTNISDEFDCDLALTSATRSMSTWIVTTLHHLDNTLLLYNLTDTLSHMNI